MLSGNSWPPEQGWRKELKPGGPLLNFHLHSSLGGASRHLARTRSEVHFGVAMQYSEKLTVPLTSSSARSATFIVQNSNLNRGFLRQFTLPVGQYLGQFKQPAAGEIF